MRYLRSLSVAALAVIPLAVSAISFPDVPSNYPHKAAIEALADRGVIGGNPDGTFAPHNPVDRASILKMLYKAANITPDLSKVKCMSDVAAGSWYETFVCDAVARDNEPADWSRAGPPRWPPCRRCSTEIRDADN